MSAIKIVSIDENQKMIFHKNVFDESISKVDPTLPVCIVTINGAFRSGKSFILNFLASYFKSQKCELCTFFEWKHGKDLGTTGMWMLDEPIIVEKQNERFGVLIIDTQGIFDTNLNTQSTALLFALSTLISSYQIYNIDKRIQEDHLQHLALFSEYARMMSEKNKPFQHLNFLIRDWQNFSELSNTQSYSEESDKYLFDVMDKNKKEQGLRETRDHIISSYEEIDCNLLPHPGFKVSEGSFDGNIDDIRCEFKEAIWNYSKYIYNNLSPKKIIKVEMNIGELSMCISKYIEMLYSDEIPTPKTILQTTIEIVYLNAIYNSMRIYMNIMSKIISSDYLNDDAFTKSHDGAKRNAIAYFNSKAIIGTDLDKQYSLQILEERIDFYEKEYLKINTSKKKMMLHYYPYIWSVVILWLIRLITTSTCSLDICYKLHSLSGIIMYSLILYSMYLIAIVFGADRIIIAYYNYYYKNIKKD